MKEKNTRWSLLILILLVFMTFFFLLKNHELGKLLKTTLQTNPKYLIVGLFMMFLFVAGEAAGIKVILHSLKYRHSIFKCLKYAFIGFYYCSVIPASAGQPVQIYYMSKDDIESGDSTLAIMLVTVSYQIGILIICSIALILRFRFVMHNLGIVKYFSLFGVIIDIIMIALLILTTFPNRALSVIISVFVKMLSKVRIIKKPEKTLDKVHSQLEVYRRSASYLKSNPNVLMVLLLTIIIKVLSRMSVAYAVYKAFGLSGHGYLDILALQAFLALGIEYLPIPGSVGAAEAGFIKVNSLIFGSDMLIPATLLTRGISFYAYLIISGLVAVFAHVSKGSHGARQK